MKTTIEASIWLGQMQVEMYRLNPNVYMNAFCNGSAMRSIMVTYYNILTKKGQLMYIEVLEPELKKDLKKTAVEISAGRLGISECVDLCKCIHIIAST